MNKSISFVMAACASICFSLFTHSALADAKIGVVIMHGKGGGPNRHVDVLAKTLTERGFKVANLEMPWSGSRQYDADTAAAVTEIDKALDALRASGAQKLFVGGHSQGAGFAMHYGATHKVAGVVAIAPGGDPASKLLEPLYSSMVSKARDLIDEGKGDEKTAFNDYEGRSRVIPLLTTPKNYFSWFNPDSAMSYSKSAANISSDIPVLWIVPTQEKPGLKKYNVGVYDKISRHSLTKLEEPDADHYAAPTVAIDLVAQWMKDVASGN